MRLRRKDYSKIVIRARHGSGNKMRLAVNPKGGDGEVLKDCAVVDIVPDGRFHDYVVGINRFKGEHIDWLALSPSNAPGDEVELASISLVSEKKEYQARAAGVAGVSKGPEHRPCIFLAGDRALVYKVRIPQGERPALSFGLGLMDSAEPVECVVELRGPGGSRELFRKKLTDDGGWEDFSVGLGGLSGDTEITFRTVGHPGGVAFFSSPTISVPPKKRMDVVWYVEDALRADHLSLYGYERETSPFLDGLAGEGVVFLNAYSQGAKTGISCSSFFTGLHPTATGVWDNDEAPLAAEYLTLAEVMRSQGFETAAFIQNYFAGPTLGLDQGFDHVFTMVGEPASSAVDRATEWIRGRKGRNFFVYVHILDPHSVYDPAKPYDSWYREGQGSGTAVTRDGKIDAAWVEKPTREGRTALYDGEIRSDDEQFGRFVTGLREMGLFGSTLLVFSSDHGEYLGERGYWDHHPPCFRAVHHVPLVMVYPDRIKGPARVEEDVQLLDIMPTVLGYVGVDTSGMALAGDPLSGLMEGVDGGMEARIVLTDEVSPRRDKTDLAGRGSAFYNGYHYVKTMDMTRKKYEWLFNLDDYPDEEKGTYNPVVSYMLSGALDRAQGHNHAVRAGIAKDGGQAKKEDQEVREQLKALGYLQ